MKVVIQFQFRCAPVCGYLFPGLIYTTSCALSYWPLITASVTVSCKFWRFLNLAWATTYCLLTHLFGRRICLVAVSSNWKHRHYFKSEAKNKAIVEMSLYQPLSWLNSTKGCCKNLKIKIYRTIILPVVLYGCEAWSLTLREERKLRGFENMVLRRIFGPRRDEVMGEWRRLHNEELNDLYSSTQYCAGDKIEKN